jgi:glycosyltransferase involved in cell wall biosynthesis
MSTTDKRRARLLFDREGWAYHRRAEALRKYAPDHWQVELALGNRKTFPDDSPDIWLQPSYNCTMRLRDHIKRRGDRGVIVTNYTTGWLREGPHEGRDHWPNFYAASDWIVFNNRAAWGLAGMPAKTSWISNGVDRQRFFIDVAPDRRAPKVLWCGSTYHTQPNKDLKGYYRFLLPLQERLAARGVPLDLRRVDSCKVEQGHGWTADEMRQWYNAGTVYLCCSNSEGTPNPALEAASCGCVLVSTCVGNMPELIEHGVNGLLCDRTIDDIESAVMVAVERYHKWQPRMEEAIAPWCWSRRAAAYYRLFDRLIAARETREA